MRDWRTTRKFAAGGLLALLLATQVFLATPQRAYAGFPVAVDADAPATASWASQEVRTAAKKSLVNAVFVGLVNLLTFAANRLAYDAAVMLASGGAADSPLVEYRSVNAYLDDYKAAVAGEAFYLLSEEIADAGGFLSNFDFCAPSNPEILLQLRMGIRSIYDRPEPRCDINKVKDNWEGWMAELETDLQGGAVRNDLILGELAKSLNPTTNEFAVGIALYSDILGKSNEDSKLASAKLIAQGPVKDVTDKITGRVDTPSSFITTEFEQKKWESATTGRRVAMVAMENTDVLVGLGTSMGSVFANTLLSELTNKLYTGLFDFDAIEDVNPFDYGMIASSGREAAQKRFRSLLAVAPLEVTNYSILSEFSSCPSTSRGLYNCVADSSLISAVARAEAGAPLTLEEAMEDELIDGSWPLIPSADSARDQDPYCFTYGFCHSNLVKLRKARIIPIGWELAAESTANSTNDPVTLQEVVDGFDDCNTAGERDDNYPWCKLVDPDWVLKYPDTQCRALVYGQLLETSASDTRQQECVDMPSCIAEDENGNCTGGYGYCVREANTWLFRGDSCPEYAASCLSVSDPDGEDASFILNTVDYANCDESNAGCLWYWDTQTEDADGAFAWPTIDTETVDEVDATDGTHEDRVYFTAAVEECDEDNGGCSELIERDEDLRLNEIMNASFDDDEDGNSVPDAWTFTDAAVEWDDNGDDSRTGSGAVNTGAGIAYQSGLVLQQGTFYSLSFYASQQEGSTGKAAEMIIALESEGSSESVDLTGTSYSDGCALYGSLKNTLTLGGTPNEDGSYERYECTFTTPRLSSDTARLIAYVDVMPGSVWVDDVQLEQGEDVSDYHTEYGAASLSYTYAKVAPEYLGCDGTSDDPAACENYAQVCAETEVGCTAYAPVNGDPTVYGVASSLDECPSSCVGYDTYKQEASYYEPSGDFPVYFIPDTAESCSEESVGCDEFTRLSDESLAYFTYVRACVTPDQADANTGGDDAATFYTWEGSDLTGYQLVTWTLLESDLDSVTNDTYTASGLTEAESGKAPCTNWTADDDGITCNDDGDDANGHFDTDSEDCDEHDDIFSNPNCREFYDTDGGIHYRDWSHTVTVNNACASFRKTDLVGLGDDNNGDGVDDGEENCVASGGYFDTPNSTCRYYGYEDESEVCAESENGCREYTGGRSRNSRLVFTETFEDGDLTNWEAEATATVTYSNESVATDGHSLAAEDSAFWSYFFDNSGECDDGDTGEGCESDTGVLGGTCTVTDGDENCGTLVDELYAGKTYTLSFWGKGTGTLNVGFDVNFAGSPSFKSEDPTFASVDLSASGWQEYQIGPLDISESDYADFGDDTVLAFVPDTGVTFYIDNIVLREGEENITIIKDSWVTPSECDETPEGIASSQYYLGCQEYTTQDGETANLKSFSSLCEEDVVGCDDFFATHESESPYAQVYSATCSRLDGDISAAVDCYTEADGTEFDTTSPFLCTIGIGEESCQFDQDWYMPTAALPSHIAYGPETEIVPADTTRFLVVTDDVECDSSEAGCTEFGAPVFSADRQSVASSESVWLLDLPADYADTLCSHSELFCQEWESEDDGTFYFKDPVDQTCEYRTDVTINGGSYDGWFRTDSDAFCYGTCEDSGDACASDADCDSGDSCDTSEGSYLIGGDQSGIWLNGDDEYGNWVGACDEQYSGCREFIDMLDVGSENFYGEADGEAYYYLDNESLEEGSLPSSQQCDGQVSQKEGCGLFRDTTESSMLYSATASFTASAHADLLLGDRQFALVDPIDCETGDSTITTPDGEEIDLCERRCEYDNTDLYNISGGSGSTYGTSCYVSDDCASYESESGDMVEGSCVDDATRLENDVNRIVKVNRDRQCSEWLSCSDAQTVWDERTNSYKTICGDISLCDEYSADGNASFCSSWKQDSTATVIDISRYSERDVSWYGDDYSGMAIPDLFPVELLTQELVSAPSLCDLSQSTVDFTGAAYDAYEGQELHGAECDEDSDCQVAGLTGETCVLEGTQEFALAFNAGECDEYYGDECTVGYCENTGEACADAAACGDEGGECLIGEWVLPLETTCYEDADCQTDRYPTATCSAGQCIQVMDEADIGDAGETDATVQLRMSVLAKTGTCVRNACLLTPDGDPFEIGAGDAKTCRAYPEANSPFPNEVVTTWRDPATDVTSISESDLEDYPDALPYDLVSGFASAKTCAPNEDCVCSYNKVTYGGGSVTRYYADDSENPAEGQGICSGGDQDGEACTVAEGCDDGTCELPTREDQVLGLEGYCLERDTGINIHGNRDGDHRACVTWLPVDQLSGSTDLYAKYITAGFFEDTYMCSRTDGYVSLEMSKHGSGVGDIACAETSGLGMSSYQEAYDKSLSQCSSRVECPSGYVAILGAAEYDDTAATGILADGCSDSSGADNDCPFVCVPEISGKKDSTTGLYEACSFTDYSWAADPQTSSNGTTVYWAAKNVNTVEMNQAFDTAVEYFDDCVARGVGISELAEVMDFPCSTGMTGDYGNCDDANSTGYRDLHLESVGFDSGDQIHPYEACEAVTQVAAEDESYAWTDRIYNTTDPWVVNTSLEDTAYTKDVDPNLFGATGKAPGDINEFGPPMLVAQCDTGSGGLQLPDVGDGTFEDCGTGSPHSSTGADPTSDELEARALLDFEIEYYSSTAYSEEQHYISSSIGSTLSAENEYTETIGIITSVFAKIANAYTYMWDGTLEAGSNWRGYTAETTEEAMANVFSGYANDDDLDVREKEGEPPTVWSLNLSTCEGTECEEGDDGELTLNSANSGAQSGTDFFRAYLKFYAAANKNQLPIRRIIVDWGDGDESGSNDDENYYKNHRGFVTGTDESQCEQEDEWGKTSASCDPNYFSYNHIYTCSGANVEGAAAWDACEFDDAGELTNSPCTYNEACYFRPRVHIRDNWGWCTGECEGGDDESEGCFEGVDTPAMSTSSADNDENECNYQDMPNDSYSADPWVYYSGVVVVNP